MQVEGQEPVEAAERVLEVLSGSFETLQKAVAGRPREPGARANTGGRRWKLQGRFWRAKGARREQLMQVEGQEPVEVTERVLEVVSVSFGTLQKAVWLEG